MKKHYCVVKTENGLIESVIFSELSGRELKKQDATVLTVISSERVSHPSPELLVKALKKLGYNVASVYATCYQLQAEDAPEDATEGDKA